MKIGIIEICEPNHYTAVEALAITYAQNNLNQITVFTLSDLKISFPFPQENIKTELNKQNETVLAYLKRIAALDFDVIHINTISSYYKEFSCIDWQSKTVLTIHNIETFFDNPLKKQVELLKFRLKKASLAKLKTTVYLPIKYFIKEKKRQRYRDIVVEKAKAKGDKILVYGNTQKEYLQRYLKAANIIVFPFCIHQTPQDLSLNNKELRVCIPGSVDDHRRDYDGLLEGLKENATFFKGKIMIDLLGYIPKNNQYLIPKIKELQNLGLLFRYQKDFIQTNEFENRLNSCDIILGNLKPSLDNQSKYGQTKETGVIFNMIKAAKPGIFPNSYPIPNDLKTICLSYQDNALIVLKQLIENPSLLVSLKEKAKLAVKVYEPKNLYPKLIQDLK
ncbi:hypothetical protein I5M32_04720 [Pedobacter sp. SD-b]|uniref:Uncharacterized protein n=1 Tax=Pedobacter segetis TaxID=2793069 RepID=A0ABS1BIR9_9SPHI|nr:hypothetical protein [Pedobacter segetis]MBK0382256.1 hypothetical protein [Pedobacter segetis]